MKATRGKWGKYNVLKKDEQLRPYLPETQFMNKERLWRLIEKYNTVILKPCGGSMGYGVIQISSKGNFKYEVHSERNKKTIQGRAQTYSYVEKKMRNRQYIIQKRIPLATINGHPFDLRVMVQRKKRAEAWRVTGMFAKEANEGYIITNSARSVLLFKDAIRRSILKQHSMPKLLTEIKKVSLQAARQMRGYYPTSRTIGLDIGIDRKGKVWIIEANLKPFIFPFLLLKGKKVYRRIISYKQG